MKSPLKCSLIVVPECCSFLLELKVFTLRDKRDQIRVVILRIRIDKIDYLLP